jgi:hypothetical protein
MVIHKNRTGQVAIVCWMMVSRPICKSSGGHAWPFIESCGKLAFLVEYSNCADLTDTGTGTGTIRAAHKHLDRATPLLFLGSLISISREVSNPSSSGPGSLGSLQ